MNVEEILEGLGIVARLPDARFLFDLFDAFYRVVPFESASKIVRNADVADLAEKPRVPGIFWADHLAFGTGGTCFARVAAFAALAEALGFRPARILGGITVPRSHAALLFALDGRTWLVDAGYPLPEPVALETAPRDTPIGSWELTVSAETARLRFVSGPEYGRTIDFSLAPCSDDEFRGRWEASFTRPSTFLQDVVIRKPDGHRVLRFFRGSVDVMDAHSRARIPLAPPRAGKLAGLFGIEEEIVGRSLAIAGDREPERPAARIETWSEGPESEGRFAALATPEGYRRYLSGLGSAVLEERGPGIWRAVIRPDEGEPVVEEIELHAADALLRVRRSAGLADSGFAIDRSAGAPRLVRFADLPDAREEFLRTDAGRGRIAGILAMDLLALSRS